LKNYEQSVKHFKFLVATDLELILYFV